MTVEQIKQASIGEWKSIAPEIRPSAQKNADGTYTAKNKLANHCWKLQHANVITWDGLVVPCCFDKDAAHQLGNLKNQSFREIWHNGNYKQFRHKLMKSRKNIDICANCSEGVSVWKD